MGIEEDVKHGASSGHCSGGPGALTAASCCLLAFGLCEGRDIDAKQCQLLYGSKLTFML